MQFFINSSTLPPTTLCKRPSGEMPMITPLPQPFFSPDIDQCSPLISRAPEFLVDLPHPLFSRELYINKKLLAKRSMSNLPSDSIRANTFANVLCVSSVHDPACNLREENLIFGFLSGEMNSVILPNLDSISQPFIISTGMPKASPTAAPNTHPSNLL